MRPPTWTRHAATASPVRSRIARGATERAPEGVPNLRVTGGGRVKVTGTPIAPGANVTDAVVVATTAAAAAAAAVAVAVAAVATATAAEEVEEAEEAEAATARARTTEDGHGNCGESESESERRPTGIALAAALEAHVSESESEKGSENESGSAKPMAAAGSSAKAAANVTAATSQPEGKRVNRVSTVAFHAGNHEIDAAQRNGPRTPDPTKARVDPARSGATAAAGDPQAANARGRGAN
mmetsp:Transcript_17403/g.49749  ORF Transcript_17403/g.49749 Transcript_17403/m.49749 type:complete len:240 (-) Transcript_17403:623-1342(-)